MNNSNDFVNTDSQGKSSVFEESHGQSAERRECSPHYIGNSQGSSKMPFARRIRSESLLNMDNTVQLIAKFILDCLGHLPSEFWGLAADILLSGFRTGELLLKVAI
uniref:Uncharacterized protein n=1 Tax=Arundo donax TaxID=35708 RepID=A0A0A9B1I7_ARUDO